MVFNKIINSNYEIRCLKKKWQENFEIKGQIWIGASKRWLWKKLLGEAKSIDLLHLYHIWYRTFFYAIIYKLKNPHGKVYVKLDAWIHTLKQFQYIFRIFNKPILSLSNIVWYEDKRIWNRLKKTYPKYKDRIIKTTNGIDPIEKYIWNIEKQNIIILCWRFGSIQKNNELLIKMLQNNDTSFLDWWKFLLIWSYTDQFLKQLEELFIKKPKLRDIFQLPWFIQDIDEKYKLFCFAKIFLHTANFEWDPNIQYDAMFWWCFLISTDVANIPQNYPPQYSLFYKINDEEWLLKQLKKWVQKVNRFSTRDYINIQDYCLQHFTYEKVLSPVIKLLNDQK